MEVPFQVALEAYHGTPRRALADRKGAQQVRKALLYQLVYYESTIIVHGWKDECSANKSEKGETLFRAESETKRTGSPRAYASRGTARIVDRSPRIGERNALRCRRERTGHERQVEGGGERSLRKHQLTFM